MGTSVDDGARKSNNWIDQWSSDKLGTGSRVQSFPRAFPSSSDVPILLLNQPVYKGSMDLGTFSSFRGITICSQALK